MEKVSSEVSCESPLLPKKLVQLMDRNNSENNQVDIVYASSGSEFKENEYSQLKSIVDSLLSFSTCNGKSVNNVDVEDPKEEQDTSRKTWSDNRKESSERKSSNDSVSYNAGSYYGVCIPSGTNLTEDDTEFLGVFSDKKEALRAVKKYKGARFKAFKTHSEALNFANQSEEQIVHSPSFRNGSCSNKDPENSSELGPVGEKPSPFKAPKSQDLVKLRKAIESGDTETVNQTIWSNPRYLISNGDTPAILQEGSRYNALHVAAKSKQTVMAKLILETIDNPKFMQLLYSEDNEATCLKRVQFLTDLYLNTPDKAISETPLHFASKFGCAKIVDILASHPACIKNLKNKYGKTPQEIACSRCSNESAELKSQIIGYLQDRCYIPVLRSEDNSTQPVIGSPWSPEAIKGQTHKIANVSTSPVEAPMSVKAFAGPMSPSQAAEFHKRWRNYPSFRTANKNYLRHITIRLSDTEKGLERIGRELASELKVPWTEYWSFLKCYCNLTTSEGLSKLENYLKKKNEELIIEESLWKDNHSQHILSEISQVMSDNNKSLTSNEENVNESLTSLETSGLSVLCERLNRLCLNSSDSVASNDRSHRFSAKKQGTQQKIYTNLSDEPYQTNSSPCSEEKNEDPPLSSNISVFLDRTCQVIANQITYQAKTTAESSQDYWFSSRLPYQMFSKAILPFAKCLMNIVSNVQVSSELKESCLRTVHYSVARKVMDLVFEDEYVSVFLEQFSKQYRNETFSDSSDEEEEFQCWSRQKYREKQINPALMKFINQHNSCILNLLCVIQNNPQSSSAVECCCIWPNHQFLHEDFRNRQSFISLDQKSPLQEPYSKDNPEEKSSPRSSSPIHTALEDILSHSSCGASSCSDYSDVFITPPSSRHSSRCSSINEVVTPDEGIAVFILGSYPTKLDLDVLRALENASVDPILYPHICRWQHLMISFPKEVVENWPSPFCPRARKRSDRLNTCGSSVSDSPTHTLSPLARYPLSSTPTKCYPDTEYHRNLESSQINLYKKFFQSEENSSH